MINLDSWDGLSLSQIVKELDAEREQLQARLRVVQAIENGIKRLLQAGTIKPDTVVETRNQSMAFCFLSDHSIRSN